MYAPKETLRFEDLTPYLLLKNGNFLYRVPFLGGSAVLKVYYGSRGPWARLTKSLENVIFQGQTSYLPRTRRRVERECMALWQEHGFRVFEVYDNVEVLAPGCPLGGYLLMEYLDAPKLLDYLADGSVDLAEKMALFGRWLAEWGRRHQLAIDLREPRLVHENGDGDHVMLLGGGFLWFDFEMVWRSRRKVADHVSHEIIQYLWQILKSVPGDVADAILSETVARYPSAERLARAHDYFLRHPNLFHRLGRALHRRFNRRARKPTSKYNVARRLRARLAGGAPGRAEAVGGPRRHACARTSR